MEKLRIVTTSWDDGERTDLRIAEMLQSRGVRGTFYVPVHAYQGRPALSHADLRQLSIAGFEIGAHTVSHKLLWGLSSQELAEEIDPCKPALEDIVGSEVRMFCYPCGRYDSNVVHTLKKAGYHGARTVRMLATQLRFHPFEMPTSLQICPHPRVNYFKNIARARKLESLQVCLANLKRLDNWLELGKRLFDSVIENGGVWHMYGHSFELEQWGLWEGLAEILDYVSGREGVMYVRNFELIPLLSAQNSHPGNGNR
jgi:peptidoglycan/xylan/chitin deacetylase (PgdA/CDA1 family)